MSGITAEAVKAIERATEDYSARLEAVLREQIQSESKRARRLEDPDTRKAAEQAASSLR